MWRQALNQQGLAFGLNPEQISHLEQRLGHTVFSPSVPAHLQRFLGASPLTETLRLSQAFDVEQACRSLEVTAMLAALCLETSSLEKIGLFSPSAYAALEYALAEQLPHLEDPLRTATRMRLRLAINPPLPT